MSTGSANFEECNHSPWHCMHVGGVTGFLKNTADWLHQLPPPHPVKIRFSQTGLRSLLKRGASWAEPSRRGGIKISAPHFATKLGPGQIKPAQREGRSKQAGGGKRRGRSAMALGGGGRSTMASVEYMPRDSVLWERDPDVDEWGHLEGIRHQLFDIPLHRKQTTAHK